MCDIQMNIKRDRIKSILKKKSSNSFGQLRRWYLLGSIHIVSMVTGQLGACPPSSVGRHIGPEVGVEGQCYRTPQ